MLTTSPLFVYLIIAVILIAVELVVFQFSFFWTFFIGLGALVATLVAYFFPSASWLTITSVFVVASFAISLLLYKPLKNWQNKPGRIAGNNAIGQKVDVIEPVTADKPGKVLWSGTDWKAELAPGSEEIHEGDQAVITGMEGIRLEIKKLS